MSLRRPSRLILLTLILVALAVAGGAAPAAAAPVTLTCSLTVADSITPGLTAKKAETYHEGYGTLACVRKPLEPPVATGIFGWYLFGDADSCTAGHAEGGYGATLVGVDGSRSYHFGTASLTWSNRVVAKVVLGAYPFYPSGGLVGTMNGAFAPLLDGLCLSGPTEGAEIAVVGKLKQTGGSAYPQ